MNGSEDLFRAVFPDDVHLAPSKNTDGAFRGAVLDNMTNVLRGQAEFVKVDIGDATAPDGGPPVLLAAALGVAAGVLVTAVVVKATPRVKRWWLEDARPRVKATTGRFTKSKGDESDPVVLSLVVPSEVEPSEFSLDEVESG